MRTAAIGTLVTVAALGAAPSANAQAGTLYGGSAVSRSWPATPTISLLLAPDGRVTARVGTGFTCPEQRWTQIPVRLSGRTTGTGFSARGHFRLRGRGGGLLQVKLTGTVAGTVVTGTYHRRLKGCGTWTSKFVLHAQATPAGASAPPPRKTTMFGVTGQSAGALKLPVALRVTGDGRVYARWEALAQCTDGNGRVPVMNATPLTKVKPDGTFSRSERFTIRFTDGSRDVISVTFSGSFVPGGAVGTLKARLRHADRRGAFPPCLSGTQPWSATM